MIVYYNLCFFVLLVTSLYTFFGGPEAPLVLLFENIYNKKMFYGEVPFLKNFGN